MRRYLSLVIVLAGAWLVYMGYQRQNSIVGRTDSTVAKIGQTIDGGDHTTTHMKYYIAGAVLVVGGLVGLCSVRD